MFCLGETKLLFSLRAREQKKKKSVGRQNKNNIIWFLESVFFKKWYFAKQTQKKNPRKIISFNNL